LYTYYKKLEYNDSKTIKFQMIYTSISNYQCYITSIVIHLPANSTYS